MCRDRTDTAIARPPPSLAGRQMQLKTLLLSADSATKRIVWVDNAKALLIVLVVLGHFAALWYRVKTIDYAFHLPAFLFLTGFMLSSRLEATTFRDFLGKYVFPFARLYAVVSVFSIIIWIVLRRKFHVEIDSVLTAIWQSIYGTQADGDRFLHENGPIWYLPFLVSTFLVLYATMRLPTLARIPVFIALFLFTTNYSGPRLPWALDATGVGLAFVGAGLLFRRSLEGPVGRIEIQRWMLVPIGVVAALAMAALALKNGTANINIMEFGRNNLIYLLAAFLGTMAVAALCLLVPRTKLADLLSTHSLVIFCIHIYAVKELKGPLGMVPWPAKQLALPFIALAIAIVCALISVAIMPALERYVMRRPRGKPVVQPPADSKSSMSAIKP